MNNALRLLLFVVFAGCTGEPLVPASEGEGELDYATNSVQPGGACLVDSDCNGQAECLRGFCFVRTADCVDDTHALRADQRDQLSDTTVVDCTVWGGWCEYRRGCVLPEGSECVRGSACGVEAGSWLCSAHRVCDDRPANISSPAFPQPITLPATVTFDAGQQQCVAVDLDAPAGIIIDSNDAILLIQQGFDQAFTSFGVVQAEIGRLIICSAGVAATVSLEQVAFDDVRLGNMCVDETHERFNDEVIACPAGATCSTRLQSFPVCRSGVGDEPCFRSQCPGSCLSDGDTSVCTAERLNPDNGSRCTDGAFQDHDRFPGRIRCSERCEDLLGCVVEPGHACFSYELCIDPITLDDLNRCPDTGVCPE
jgi:hypothetical protein